MAASVKSRRACGPSFVFLASARSCDALKSPRNDTGIAMTNLHRSPPMNQSETDLEIVNESQLLRFGIRPEISVPGHSRPNWVVCVRSALPPVATDQRTSREVRKVPRRDSCTAANSHLIRL